MDTERVEGDNEMSDLRERVSLLPCPFCGSAAIVRHNINYAVCCTKCHGETALVYRYEDDAIIAWNRRSPIAPSDAGLRELLARIKGLSDSLNDRHPSIAKEIRDLSAGLAPAASDGKGKRYECQRCGANGLVYPQGHHDRYGKICHGPVVEIEAKP